MRWPFALRAEIGGGFDKACAEELLPEAIHGDPRRERMVGADEPAREIEAIGRVAGRQRREHTRHTAWHWITTLIVLAALEDVGFARLFQFQHHHGGREVIVQLVALLP